MKDTSHKRTDRHGRLSLGVEDIVKANKKEQNDKRTKKTMKTMNLLRRYSIVTFTLYTKREPHGQTHTKYTF